MHEHFITRRDVQGCSDEAKRMIIVAANCVLVHPGNCHWQAQSFNDGKKEANEYIIQWEGLESVIRFLDLLQENMRLKLPYKVKYDILQERTSVLIQT
jgi:hypothetical protein